MKRTIHFIDNGQDFLEWDIDDNGVVIDCRPFQASFWYGTKVLNKDIEVGEILELECLDGEKRLLAHRVERVSIDLKAHRDALMKKRREAFHGRVYRYQTGSQGIRTIGVCKVMGVTWAVCWISECGGRRRIKSGRLPVMDNPAKLQPLLDAWAAGRKLPEVT